MPSSIGSVRGTRQLVRPAPQLPPHAARVIRVRQVSPSVRQVTFVGEDLARLPFHGPDQRVRLLLPAYVLPVLRTFTVRHHRPGAAEIDLDFVAHPGAGVANRWAAQARPGDQVTLYGPVADYAPPDDTQWQLIAGDSSALPAVACLVESLRHYDRARVIVEIDHPDDSQEFDSAAQLEVVWLHRGGTAPPQSRLLLDALLGTPIPDVPLAVWLAGESAIVAAARRGLITELGVSPDDISHAAYWRFGRPEASR